MNKQFGVLRVLATVFKVLGIALAVVAVIGGLISTTASFVNTDLFTEMGFDETTGALVGLIGSLAMIVFGLLSALLLYGFGELIIVFLSIEENTAKTANLLVEITEEEPEAKPEAKKESKVTKEKK